MKRKILIVEDEPAIAENIKFALETEGFETVWHDSGEKVLSLLSEGSIHLIVLDIGLPDVNGMDLCRDIRKSYTLPIIFLTARSDEIDRIVGLEIGADDYMSKPFSPRELAARVKAVLRRTNDSKGKGSEVNLSSAFKVDESRFQITYVGQPLDLSRYEYKILEILIKRPGHVFSRDNLMEKVWDEPEMSMDRTVDAHIKNIRKKLKEINPGIDPIVTHRSIGYSLKEDL
jgi:two-component system catabolic regulation response regulator CreB